MNAARILQLVLAAMYLYITYLVCMDIHKNHKGELYGASAKKWAEVLGIGFITNFFDTLGIGSFAPTTFLFKFTGCVDDVDFPGVENIGDTFPVVFEALIFITTIDCNPIFLVAMCVAAAAGSILGAFIVTGWDVVKIRIGMGIFLIFTAIVLICRNAGVGPFGLVGDKLGLEGPWFVAGLALNFFFGMLMNLGFGLYAPCMAICLLGGCSPSVIFPVMMGSCALLMPCNSTVFIKKGRYDPIAVIGLMVGGVFGVLIAWKVVTSLPLTVILYIVCVVMIITSVIMFRDAKKAIDEKKRTGKEFEKVSKNSSSK